MAKRALDSSEYAGKIDWVQAREQGFDIGIARAVGGTILNKRQAVRLDKRLVENATKIAEANLERRFYVPFFPDIDFNEQLDAACEAFEQVKLDDNDGVAVDFEVLRGVPAREGLELVSDFCAGIETEAKRTPWFYSSPGFLARFTSLYETNADDGTLRKTTAGNPVPSLQKLTGYPLWLEDHRPRLGPPPVPGQWEELTAWQFRGDVYVPCVGLCHESVVYDDGEIP